MGRIQVLGSGNREHGVLDNANILDSGARDQIAAEVPVFHMGLETLR